MPVLATIHFQTEKSIKGGGGVLRFAVIQGLADFQGRLFDPKYIKENQAICQQHRIRVLECPQENERVIVTEDLLN